MINTYNFTYDLDDNSTFDISEARHHFLQLDDYDKTEMILDYVSIMLYRSMRAYCTTDLSKFTTDVIKEGLERISEFEFIFGNYEYILDKYFKGSIEELQLKSFNKLIKRL